LAKFQATSLSASNPSPTRRAVASGCWTAFAKRSAAFRGTAATSATPRATSCTVEGSEVRDPLALLLCRLGNRLHVEEHGRDVDAGDAVDQRVVGLGEEREAIALQPLHQPHLPQRLRAVERLRKDPGGQSAQLPFGAGGGQRGMADVVGEVEAGVVCPQRPPGLKRREDELLAEARHEIEPRADLVEEVLVAGRRALEDQHRPHMHVAGRGLVGKERGVY